MMFGCLRLPGPEVLARPELAIRVVSSIASSAHFVELADVQQPALILPAIAVALGIMARWPFGA